MRSSSGTLSSPMMSGSPPVCGESFLGTILKNLPVGVTVRSASKDRMRIERACARLQAEWAQAVAYAEQLKQRVEGDPRVHYFAISRRNNDVIIRAQRA